MQTFWDEAEHLTRDLDDVAEECFDIEAGYEHDMEAAWQEEQAELRRRAMQPQYPPDGVRIGKQVIPYARGSLPAPARAEVVECLEE